MVVSVVTEIVLFNKWVALVLLSKPLIMMICFKI